MTEYRSVRECWSILEDVIEDEHDEGAEILCPPATEEEIASVTETLGFELPQALSVSLQCHNGQAPNTKPILGRYAYLSTDQIEQHWQRMTDNLEAGVYNDTAHQSADETEDWRPAAEIKDVWWNDSWVPFGIDPGGHMICIDLDPSPDGDTGQVITMWRDVPTRAREGEHFEAWFSSYVDALLDGELVYSEETHSMFADPEEIAIVSAQRIDDPTSADLRAVYKRHHDRASETGGNLETDGNWFVELCFAVDGDVSTWIQYQWGMLNLAGLADDQHERANTIFDDENLPVVADGDAYITVSEPDLDIEQAIAVTKRVLTDVYDRELADVEQVRERMLELAE